MKFSILLPSWKDYKYLELCLSSLKQRSFYDHQILIHLNEYDEEIKALASRYDAGCTYSIKNEGIAYGTNRCAERATNEFMFFPNSDMVFLPGWDIALRKAIEKFGPENVYSATMIEPWGSNENFVIKDYGREPEEFKQLELLQDLPLYRTGKYYKKHIVPYLFPKELFTPMDERMWPGWTTDDDIAVAAYTTNPDIRFIRVQDALIYHFMCKSTYRIGNEQYRWELGIRSKRLFDQRWSIVYPGMNSENYRQFIYKDFEGMSEL